MLGYFRLASSGNKPGRATCAPRGILGLAAAAMVLAAAIIPVGCDSRSTFLPPPPDGLRSPPAEELVNVTVPPELKGASVGVRSVELILDRRDPGETEAGPDRCARPGGSGTGQAQNVDPGRGRAAGAPA